MELKNTSEQDVTLIFSAPEQDFTFTVVGPDGRAAAITKRGENRRSTPPNGSHVLVTLPPQQTVSRTCILSDMVDFSRSGTYRVAVSRHFDTISETASSNTVEVKIPQALPLSFGRAPSVGAALGNPAILGLALEEAFSNLERFVIKRIGFAVIDSRLQVIEPATSCNL